jgi:hypothetical protein
MQPGKQPGQVAALGKGGAGSKDGSEHQNTEVPPGVLQMLENTQGDSTSTELSKQDAANGALINRDAAWFAKLPPELRNAIRSSAKGQAPRGYEERLRRYFQNVE